MILGIKTAGETPELVLVDEKGKVSSRSLPAGNELSEKILPVLYSLLKKTAGTKSISKIVVFSGPGSFTSLRVGHSVANTLAMALNIPIAGIKDSEIKESFAVSIIAASKKARKGVTLVPFYGKEPNITRPKKKN